MINLLMRTDFPPSGIELFRQIPEIELIFDDYSQLRSNDPVAFSQTIEALITDHRTPYQTDWDKRFPGLKLVVSLGLPPTWDRQAQVSASGIDCLYTAEAGTTSVAEMTLATMVCLSRKRAWQNEDEDAEPQAFELRDKTLGIVGFGKIGKSIAKLAHAYGMAIVYHDIHSGEGGPMARWVSLDELLRTSHYISINLPLTPETKDLLDEESFKKMRQGAFLIDMSQEGIVKVEPMKKAIESRRLAGVAADVYSRPRIKDLNLDSHDSCIWLPVRSAFTRETQSRAALEAFRLVKEYFNV